MRIVAIEGDRVELKDKKLIVNDVLQPEFYVVHADKYVQAGEGLYSGAELQHMWESRDFAMRLGSRDNFGPVIIPQGNVFVLGDNRDRAFDSRFWGPLPIKRIIGTVSRIFAGHAG